MMPPFHASTKIPKRRLIGIVQGFRTLGKEPTGNFRANQIKQTGTTAKKKYRVYSVYLIVLLRMLAHKLKWSCFRLHQRLTDIRQGIELRKILKIQLKQVPSYSTLRKHWESDGVQRLAQRINRKAVQLIQGKKEHLRVAIDSTKVELKLKVHKPFGKFGRTSKNKKFFGLKLHLAVSLKGVPVAQTVTTGNVYDSQPVGRLLSQLEVLKPIKGIWVDAAYDDEALYHAVSGRDMGYLTVTKRNPRRNKDKITGDARLKALKNTCLGGASGKRQIVEQVFDILKDEHLLTIPWWCQTREQMYHWMNWNVHVVGLDMLFNHKLDLPILSRKRVTI